MDLTGTTGTSSRFQHYELLRRGDGTPWELGRGTMGVTYKAFDVNLRCEVALKVVNPALLNHPNARERFVREARAAARLRHRNIASVYHLGNDGDRFFYAMEFIDGETLDGLVRHQGPLSADAALRVLSQAARALAAAARQGLIHRDIKPGNIMVVREDADDHRVVKLIDFGLARSFVGGDDSAHLTSGGFVGTPIYTSPEQLDERPVDERSDIYSLGITVWFLLTGRPPFSGSMSAIFNQHFSKPPPWDQMPPTVPAPVRDLLAHMLEKSPERRPQTAVDLRREIEVCRESLRALGATGAGTAAAASSAAVEVRRAEPDGPAGKSAPISTPVGPPGELGPGMILKGRYELLQLAGEGNSGRVFQARDRANEGKLCAVKILRSDMTGETSEREILAEEVRLIQSAPHPNLLALHAFERLNSRDVDFLVEEWLQGFTVVDLLAARNGALSLRQGLQILAQAAAGVDHAASKGLERLDLALHQLHFHFPGLPAASEGQEATLRGLLQRPVETWPRWTLKINPLGAVHGALESSTWMGDVTLLPGATPAMGHDTDLDNQRDPLAVSYSRGLAQAVYESLGGSPTHGAQAEERRGKYVSLPTLNEDGNAVLQRALFDEPGYESSRAFFESLAAAVGFDPGALTVENPTQEPRQRSRTAVMSSAAKPAEVPGANVARSLSPSVFSGDPSTGPGGAEALDLPDATGDDPALRGSVRDRLALVSETSRRYHSWLPTVGVAGLLLAALLVIVVVAVSHHRTRGKSVRPAVANTPADHRKPQNPIEAASSLAAMPTASAAPTAARSPAGTANSTDTPSPVRDPAAPAQTPAVTPATAEVAAIVPPPLASPTSQREMQVKVHLESRPSGVEIRLGNKLLGSTPMEIILPPGEHPLVARYRNWPEVRHVLHLDSDQLTASEEIHMIPPTLVPVSEASASPGNRVRRATPESTRHDGTHPAASPAGTPPGRAPTPPPRSVVAPSPSTRNEPFLPHRSTPAPTGSEQPPAVRRALPVLTPFDPDGSLQQRPRRKAPSEPQRQPDLRDDAD